jgi:energy-coupling factor transporter ATP-binding protein EcfA2
MIMKPLKIISAEERLSAPRGGKILIAGPTGVGKTSLLRTVDASRALLLDSEAGDLSIQDVPVATIQIDDWQTARDVACRIGGPNSSFSPLSCYSQAHYDAVGGQLENLEQYDLIIADSITDVSRLCFRWAEQQPEARSERTGARDLRGAYGLLARELLLWLYQLQHVRAKHVVFIGILEKVFDEFNRPVGFQVQMEGAKVPREIGAIVDEFIVMDWIDLGDGKPTRAFVCKQPNSWGYPAKDRSGKLEQIEEPHLGKLLAKLVNRRDSVSPPKQT